MKTLFERMSEAQPMTNTPSPDEDRELIERLRELAEHNREHFPSTREKGYIALSDEAADRLESLLSDRAKLEEALRGIMDAIDTPQCGDSSVWDDLIRCDDFGGPSPLDRARTALNRSTDHSP